MRQKSKAWLDQNFADEIEREPYLGTFVYAQKEFTIVNFHAITKKMQPETEIKFFKFLPARYPQHNLIFAGDFNCPQTHSVFNPLKKLSFAPALIDVKTTLRMACKNGCTASMFDNAFYRTDLVRVENSGAFPFHSSFADLKAARAISDHLPIWLTFWPN
ncbi:MAG: hypothetical protein EOP06_23825 [Proteobacteria bacterium]|nr:MAG: hypothetical protein EOP06_23825 [Pseudomonadota bacterium]